MKVGMGIPPFSNQNFLGQSQFPQFSRIPIAGFHPQGNQLIPGNPAFEESSNQMQKKLLDDFKKAQKAEKSKKGSDGTTD